MVFQNSFFRVLYFPGNFRGQLAVISSYNARRMDRIGKYIFNDTRFVKTAKIYDMTEAVFDSFGAEHNALHPGDGGGQFWVKQGTITYVLRLF